MNWGSFWESYWPEVAAGITVAAIAGVAGVYFRDKISRLGGIFDNKIKITFPRREEILQGPKPLGSSRSYSVEGTLKLLPKDHTIWLLRGAERTENVWPQGFFNVTGHYAEGKWQGRINANEPTGTRIRIIAVVAPPTSKDFFEYFQANGARTQFAPLKRIPPECKNMCDVWVQVP